MYARVRVFTYLEKGPHHHPCGCRVRGRQECVTAPTSCLLRLHQQQPTTSSTKKRTRQHREIFASPSTRRRSSISTLIVRTPPSKQRRPVEAKSPVYHYASIQDLTPRKKHCRRKLASNSSSGHGQKEHPTNINNNVDDDGEELRSFAAACYQRLVSLGKVRSKY